MLGIEQDRARFREIVRGRIRESLRKYISKGELIAREGKDTVSVPIHNIDIPRFQHDPRDQQQIGQGQGSEGDPMSGEADGEGQGKAGDQPGEHALEVELTIDDLARLLGEELELPRIENKGKQRVVSTRERLSGVRRAGPQSLRHFKRTYREALKRQIAMGTYDPRRPTVLPIKEDMRYKAFRSEPVMETSAVIIYMMDVSGSMGGEQKEIVRIESYWIDTWIRSQYDGFETRYVIHDATAREVDRETFFRTKESGGTIISSAYNKAVEILDGEYPTEEWNVYLFHFSDGDNWSNQDNKDCVELLRSYLLPRSNLFGYGQVESPYGSGQFIKELEREIKDVDKLVLSRIPDREHIVDSIREFLGRGR
jgi:sporulation protein YhbH